MPANNLPPPIHSVEVFTDDGEQKTYQADADYYTADQMRAMHLAGIEAARGCVLTDVERLRNVIDTCFLDEADMDDLIKAADNISANLDALGRE